MYYIRVRCVSGTVLIFFKVLDNSTRKSPKAFEHYRSPLEVTMVPKGKPSSLKVRAYRMVGS